MHANTHPDEQTNLKVTQQETLMHVRGSHLELYAD